VEHAGRDAVTSSEPRFLAHPLLWIRHWIRVEVQAALEREKALVIAEDPIRVHQRTAAQADASLRAAANLVGQHVMVGRDVVLWGGVFSGGVGLELHDHVRIYDYCRLVIDQLSPVSGIVLEERVAMNFGCYLEGSGGVRIGKRTILGPNVVIVSSGHRIDPDTPVQESGKDFGAVSIGEDVWIGANAVITKGVTIGDRAVVGAGAIVTRLVPADAIVAGNPARVLRSKKTD
jgi:acetyltransferase-like isoleucine patch superfamily enzyme